MKGSGWVFALSLVCSGCATTKEAGWVRDNAVPLGDLRQGRLSEAIIEVIEGAVDQHHTIGLGEGDHYVNEKYTYRLAFLRALVLEHGARQIAMEMGGSDARRVDRYLETGDEGSLDRVVLYGYRGSTDAERRELAVFPALEFQSCEARFVSAERAFWREVFELSREAIDQNGQRIRVYGFDSDARPGGGFEDARAALRDGCTPDPRIKALRESIAPPKGSGGMREVERLRSLADEIAADPTVTALCGKATRAMARGHLDLLASSYEIAMERGAAAEDLDALRDVFTRREALMVHQMKALREALPAEELVVLFGHNLHLTTASEQLRFGPEGDDRPMWASVVTQLERAKPGSAYVLWLLYAEGTRLRPDGRGGCESRVEPRRGSLESLFSTVEGDFLLNVGDAVRHPIVDEPLDFGTETSFGSGRLREATDAIVFLESARASQ